MKERKIIRNIFVWLFQGGLVSLPLVVTSTSAISERLTWAGAVLLWFYTGRVLRQRELREGESEESSEQPLIETE